MTGEVVPRRWEVTFSFNEEGVADMLEGHDYLEDATAEDLDRAVRVGMASFEMAALDDGLAKHFKLALTDVVHRRLQRGAG